MGIDILSAYMMGIDTRWRRRVACDAVYHSRILIDHSSQKSPVIRGSFGEDARDFLFL